MSQIDTEQGSRRQVFFLGSDTGLQVDLAAEIASDSIELRGFQDLVTLQQACAEQVPDAMILDMGLVPADQTLARFLDALMPVAERPPALICITDEHGIEWRLQAIRSGAQAFFSAPVPVQDLAHEVIDLVESDLSRVRILIVEDDPNQSRVFAQVLRVCGMVVETVSDPLGILDGLGSFHPDLVLMDLYMAGATGAELTRIIRSHDVYYDIPIIVFSAEDDPDKQLEALRLGADGFVSKGVHHKELIGAIQHRIAMHRWFKGRWSAQRRRKDESGLIRKRAFLAEVDRLMRLPEPRGYLRGLMVVDVDEPQQLLRSLGISGCERLLQGLGPRIAGQLEGGESTTRIGDFRYAVLARRADPGELGLLAKRIGSIIGDFVVSSEEGPVRATVSIGIGLFSPPASDAVTLISRGHKAARIARRAGGNQVAHWAPKPADSDEAILPLVNGALANRGFQLYFQPILSLRQRRGELYEALLRLHTSDSEMIPPSELIRVADKYGKGGSVDRWVLSHALDVLESYRQRSAPLRLLVHQHLESVATPEWLTWFREQIVERDLIKQRPLLVFQAQELGPHLGMARMLMPELVRLGVDVCAANLTGASEQLVILKLLGIKLVKLPLHRIVQSGVGEVESLVDWLRKERVSIIAAGVEDSETLALAWRIRPDFVQGNYLRMPSAELGYDLELDLGRTA